MNPLQRISTGLGVAAGLTAAGVTVYAILKANGLIALDRGEGGGLIVDTFTLPTTKTEFIRVVMSSATQANSNLSARTRMLLAAWAAYESGWGKTRQAQKGFNLWNISAGRSWTGPVLPGSDTEYQPGTTEVKKITQRWRQYGSPAEAVADMLSFLSNSPYSNYRQAYQQLLSGDPSFASTLGLFGRDSSGKVTLNQPSGTASFYTKPRDEYQGTINKLVAEADRLVLSAGIAGLLRVR